MVSAAWKWRKRGGGWKWKERGGEQVEGQRRKWRERGESRSRRSGAGKRGMQDKNNDECNGDEGRAKGARVRGNQ
jgi:hypothetical protein